LILNHKLIYLLFGYDFLSDFLVGFIWNFTNYFALDFFYGF